MMSPSGASTLITSAPRSPRICVASGPSTTVVRSMILMPASGPGFSLVNAGSPELRMSPRNQREIGLAAAEAFKSAATLSFDFPLVSRQEPIEDFFAGPEQHVLVRADVSEGVAEIFEAVRRPHDVGMHDERHDP